MKAVQPPKAKVNELVPDIYPEFNIVFMEGGIRLTAVLLRQGATVKLHHFVLRQAPAATASAVWDDTTGYNLDAHRLPELLVEDASVNIEPYIIDVESISAAYSAAHSSVSGQS